MSTSDSISPGARQAEDGDGRRQNSTTPNRALARSIDDLRRSMDHVPTRTLHLSEQEHVQAESGSTPVRLRPDRPRSNQRNRTPMRAESPMDPQEFRRREPSPPTRPSPQRDLAADPVAALEPRRITIRPHAGAPVGTAVRPIRIDERRTETKSHKQGPSHRKLRRWNNDNFERLAHELSSISHSTASVLLKAKEDAHLYRSIYDPAEHDSKIMKQFHDDTNLELVRNRFFEGELPTRATTHIQRAPAKPMKSGSDRLLLIDKRLRRVMTKAASNSLAACMVLKTFETFLLQAFGKRRKSKSSSTNEILDKDWWKENELLLECPSVANRRDGKINVQFHFDAKDQHGGFHRLLLHAVSQFHGLEATSKGVSEITTGNETAQLKSSRCISVLGLPFDESSRGCVRILAALSEANPGMVFSDVETIGSVTRDDREESWTII